MQKKTAVEWLVEQVNADCLNSTFIRKELIDQAQAMEKEQIEDAQMAVFLDYEIRSSWWASWIGWNWAQNLAGKYFAWKTKRKCARYKQSKLWEFYINR